MNLIEAVRKAQEAVFTGWVFPQDWEWSLLPADPTEPEAPRTFCPVKMEGYLKTCGYETVWESLPEGAQGLWLETGLSKEHLIKPDFVLKELLLSSGKGWMIANPDSPQLEPRGDLEDPAPPKPLASCLGRTDNGRFYRIDDAT